MHTTEADTNYLIKLGNEPRACCKPLRHSAHCGHFTAELCRKTSSKCQFV